MGRYHLARSRCSPFAVLRGASLLRFFPLVEIQVELFDRLNAKQFHHGVNALFDEFHRANDFGDPLTGDVLEGAAFHCGHCPVRNRITDLQRGTGHAELIDRFVDPLRVFENTVCRCLRGVHDRVELLGHCREGIIIAFFLGGVKCAISSRKRSIYWKKLKFRIEAPALLPFVLPAAVRTFSVAFPYSASRKRNAPILMCVRGRDNLRNSQIPDIPDICFFILPTNILYSIN